MKNLKTILLTIFTLVSATEITHPILFTGPARRNAHRQQKQDAYATGVADGAAGVSGENQSDVADGSNVADTADVAVQMFSENDNDNMSIVSVASDSESDGDNESVNSLDESFIVTSDNGYNFNDEPGYGDDLLERGQGQEQARQLAIAEHDDEHNDNYVEEEVLEASDQEQPHSFLDQEQETPYDSRSELPTQNNENQTFFGTLFDNNTTPVDDFAVDQALQDAELDDDLADSHETLVLNLLNNDDDAYIATQVSGDDDVATQSVEPEVKSSEEDHAPHSENQDNEKTPEVKNEDSSDQAAQLKTNAQETSSDLVSSEIKEEAVKDQDSLPAEHNDTPEENTPNPVVDQVANETPEEPTEEPLVVVETTEPETDNNNVVVAEEQIKETKTPETDNALTSEVQDSEKSDDSITPSEVSVIPVELAEEIQAPEVQPAPVIAINQEQVRIVKVYPVYDAIRAAVKGINNATHDMINYVYSFVLSHKNKEVVQPVQTPSHEDPATQE